MAVHNVDGLELNVDRGPNWLFVKLRKREAPQGDVPQFAEITLEFASRDHLLLRGPTDELLLMEANHFRRPKTMFDGPATRAYLQQPHWNVQCIRFSGATRAQSAWG